ncbi:MAG: HEAT repeat domain-containing protein [Anaerolineae bacterium]
MGEVDLAIESAKNLRHSIEVHGGSVMLAEDRMTFFDDYDALRNMRHYAPDDYWNLISQKPGFERELIEARNLLAAAQSDLRKTLDFLRKQTDLLPQQVNDIAHLLDDYDHSGAQFRARVEEAAARRAMEASIAAARANWQRTRSSAARVQLIAVLTQYQRWNDLLPLALEDVQNAPNDRRARQLLASVYEHLGKRDDLLALLKQDLASAPGDAALRRRIAELLVQMGRYDEAIGQLQQDMAAPRPEPWAADLMLQALERAKKTDALILFLQGQMQANPSDPRRRQKLETVLEQEARWGDLIPLLEQDLQTSPGNSALRERLAVSYRKSGRLDDLLNHHLLPAAKQAPAEFPPKQAVVEALLDGQRDTDVLGYIKQELAASQTGAGFLSRFVAVLAKRKRSDLVEPLAMSCLPSSLGRMDAYMEIARGYRQNDEVKAALAFLDAMGQRFPDDKTVGDLPAAFLVESLETASSTTRSFVLKQLYARPDKTRAVVALNELFAKTNDVNVQLDVLAALVEIQKAQALPFLKASLSHSSKEVRREAAKALGQLGDKRAKRPLRRQLKVEQDASVKVALKDALHQIDPKAKEHPPLTASSVVKAMIGGGLLGAIWGWVQTFFWISPGLSDGSITLILGAISGAVIFGFPISVVRPSKSQDDGCLTLFGGGAVTGGVVGIAMILLMPILIGSSMLSFGYINDNVTIIMSAAMAAVLSVLGVIVFKTKRFWILPVTGLLLVAVVILPVILPVAGWTSRMADVIAQGRAGLAAMFDKTSNSSQNEEMVVATNTATPMVEATRSDSPTPQPTLTVPAGVPATAQSAKVMSVTDGRAIRVELVDGTATVRYAGLLIPTGDTPGAAAAAQANRDLLHNQSVWLETTNPVPAGADVEAQIWLAAGTLANLQLVEMGYALPDPTLEDESAASRLQQAAREAWEAQAGFWAGGTDVAPWAAVVVDTANIRQGPGTDRPVAGKATRSDIFVINGRNANGDWILVQTSAETTAWLFAELVQTTVPVATIPVVTN